MTQATMIVPSSVDMIITGISRIQLSARKIKAWGMDTMRPDPSYSVKRGAITGNESFHALVEYIKANGERIA